MAVLPQSVISYHCYCIFQVWSLEFYESSWAIIRPIECITLCTNMCPDLSYIYMINIYIYILVVVKCCCIEQVLQLYAELQRQYG